MENINAWAKTAENFSSVLKDAAGLFIEPKKIRSVAKAEMEVEKQKLLQEYELKKLELFKRAELRRYHTEIRRQYNLELIGQEAMQLLPEHATPENISQDWLNHYVSCAQDVGEDELRTLWASLLAQEAAQPGKYSKRTLDYLKSFDVRDCKLVEKLRPFVVKINDVAYVIQPLPGDIINFCLRFEFPYQDIIHLHDIGVISDNDFTYTIEENETTMGKLEIRYINKMILVPITSVHYKLFSVTVLTSVGKQLMDIITPTNYNAKYFSRIVDDLYSNDLDIEVLDIETI